MSTPPPREQVYQLALASGIIDPNASTPQNWMMTEYGTCDEEVMAFATALVLAERERCAKIAEQHAAEAHDAPFKDYEDTHLDGYQDASNDIAAAIRSEAAVEIVSAKTPL